MHDITVDLFYDGAWHDLVAADDVLAEQPIVIVRGDGDESAAMRPSSIVLRLANDDDRYRISNPESPLYGKAGVNTPLRVTIGGVTRGTGEVSSWRCGQSRDFRAFPRRGKAWADIEANGLSQRLNQWTEPLRSPMVRNALSLGSLTGLWPLEDTADATTLSTPLAGGNPGSFSGTVTLGDSLAPDGATASAQAGADGVLTGRFLASSVSGYQLSFSAYIPATLSGAFQEIFRWTDTAGRTWAWETNNVDFAWRIYDFDGTTIDYQSGSHSTVALNQWIRYQIRVTVSGGTVTHEPTWWPQGGTGAAGVTKTFAATVAGQPVVWKTPATAYSTGANYCGVYAVADVTDESPEIVEAFDGYRGETAGFRFVRLMAELVLDSATNGDITASALMGPQPAVSLPALLKEIRDTDDAVLFESKAAVNLILTMRNFRYNQTPALTIDALQPDRSGLPALPVEVTDDLPIHNVVTASQRDGGEYTAEDATTAMGTQAPPDGRGEYRQTVDVNVHSELAQLRPQAEWWLKRGTVDLPRFPQVTINLARMDAARIAEVESVTIGSVIEIVGYRENTIRLYVLGYTETIGWPKARSITYTCFPDQQFVTGTYDSGAVRYDSRSTTLKTAVGIGVTALTFRTVNPMETWSITGVPYDVFIAGERCRVTAMGAASLVSGSYDQAGTVARSVNGVRKVLAAGTPIHVATPGRWAL
jgi:hypothetical protein